MRLLIADDQLSLHTYLNTTMDWKSLGITEIKHAYDGREAAQIVENFLPHLLIIDIRMPFMTGIETLKHIQHLSTKPKTIILSAYDEFGYARDALRLSVAQYLLKPVDTALLEVAIRELILEIFAELQANLHQEFGKIVHYRSFESGLLHVIRDTFDVFQFKRYAVLTACGEPPTENQFIEWISDIEMTAVPILYRKNSFEYTCLLGIPADMTQSKLEQLCVQISAMCLTSLPNRTISFGISSVQEDLGMIVQCIKESEEASQFFFYHPDLVHSYNENMFTTDWSKKELQIYEKAFEEKVSLGFSTASILQLVSKMFSEFREKNLHPEKVYLLCLHYWLKIRQTMDEGSHKSFGFEHVSLEKLRMFRTVESLESFFMEAINEMEQCISILTSHTSDTILKIKHHIELNYGEDLSLQTVSQLFSIDKFQLSRMFKQEININYWAYVTQIRMKKASEMLSGTNMKNSSIAAATGFVDESHFSKAFKKYYHISPKEYRLSQGELLSE